VALVDERATPEQRDLLLGAFTGKLGGPLADLAQLVGSVKGVELRECRHPGGFLLPRYQRGTGAAFRLGRQHGLFCLGCCWATMLVGFAAGVANYGGWPR
jgi:predicted metal-binding membrane protein